MTVEQSPLDRFSNQKQQSQPPILNIEKDLSLSPAGGVIDLTNDGSEKEDDLKKAIALSLKEHEKVLGGQVSMEDQDISRVVEESLAESKAVGTKRKRGEVWQDPLNPHDRKRTGDWPVGLKNVGNTCWFSAVIQSLFHLPIFRKLVLCYVPKDWDLTLSDPKKKRHLVFMQELRKLFALLSCSKRKYVDPSHSLEEFKEAFPDSNATESQQDVSEFTHKLLEWLEEAFKIDSFQHSIGENGESVMDGSNENPMLNLFYGYYLSEGLNEGRQFKNKETFGQYPLQVNGFNDIHDTLEASMALEIESYDVMMKSGQESWFTRLPPVLLFELSRFQFNQQLARPEKIHNKLEFPEVIYMDRYMEQNKNITRSIREKVRKLKDERDTLQKQLEKYLNYGTGPKKVPLNDVLKYTLEFAESRKYFNENLSEDVEMASPSSLSNDGDSPMDSPHKTNFMDTTVNHLPDGNVPSPQHVSEVELKVLQSCLKRWRNEVEFNVKNLQESISNIDNTVKEIYNDPSLKKSPYRLHAVLVHEGQAASGHYWAYVYCPNRRLWLKFNDVAVTEATWTELQKDSMGGYHCASAYCLLYVDELRPELFEELREMGIGPDFLCVLPEDLQQYVEEDNDAFHAESEQWDLEQSRKKDSSTMTVADPDCTIIGEKRTALRSQRLPKITGPETNFQPDDIEITFSDPFLSDISKQHAFLLSKQTQTLVDQFKINPGQNALEAFTELLRREGTKLRRIGRVITNLNDEFRLQHIGIYMILNSTAPDVYLNWSIIEQFLIPELDKFQNGSIVREAALKKMEEFKQKLREEHALMYSKWHDEYLSFRRVVSFFVQGVEYFYAQNYISAANLFAHCCKLNAKLLKLPGSFRGLDSKLLQHYRRHSCLKLNEVISRQFEICDLKHALEALSEAYEYILPSMEFLAAHDALEVDTQAAEEIRKRWCDILGSELPSVKQEKLQDFLSKLLDPSNDLPKCRPAPSLRINNLEEKFKAALAIIAQKQEFPPSTPMEK